MKERPNSMAQYSEMSDPDSNASKSTVIVVVLLVVLVCGGILYFYLKKPKSGASGTDTSKVVKSDPSGKNTTDAVNCAVTWGTYEECNRPCLRSGQRNAVDSFETSTGTVTTQPKNGGTECPVLTKKRACTSTPPPCPVDCKLSEWSAWSACSQQCGVGVQERTKSIETKRKGAGKPCPLPGTPNKTLQTQHCNTDPCPKMEITGQVTVCGNGGADNCFSFDPCKYVKDGKPWCQVVNQATPIDLSSVGSKGDWPLSAYPGWCQLAGFPSVPEGIKITTYQHYDCTGSPNDDRGILYGGNCCKDFKNCTNTSEAAIGASCANPPFAHGGTTTGEYACAFQVEVLPNYTCPAKAA